MTREELEQTSPELVREIEASAARNAVQAERQRMREIDGIASQCRPEMVAEARYGESACDAKELAYRMVCADAKAASGYQEAAAADHTDSHAEEVVPVQAAEDKGGKLTAEDIETAVHNIFHKEEEKK